MTRTGHFCHSHTGKKIPNKKSDYWYIYLCDLHAAMSMMSNDMKHDISSLRFIGIEHVPLPPRGGDHDLFLKQREAFWIHTLQTLAPKGLNDYLT